VRAGTPGARAEALPVTRFPRFSFLRFPCRIRAHAASFLTVLALGLAVGGVPVASAASAAISKNVTLLAHLDNYATYSACWTYVHSDGREYAVLGTTTGTSIVNVTNPAAPYEVAFIPGLTSQWREMKSYGNYIYITTEAQGGGIQIIKMTNPELPVLVNTYVTTFNRAHTLTLDAPRGLLIANGTRMNAGATGLHILSLANPESPVDIGVYGVDYVHDSWVQNDTLYASCISTGFMRVFDFSDPTSPLDIVSWTYPGARSHSGEKSKDGRYLYVCDEQNYGTMKVFDMANIFAHPIVHIYSANPLAIAHNVHVRQDVAYMAYYTEGVRLLDLRDPALPVEWGYYDTYPGFSGGFHGVWEVATFPSGTFIASDIETGLYIFRATADYGVVKVRVRDQVQNPLSGVHVETVGAAEHEHSETQGMGAAGLALAPGSYTLRASKFGYQPVIVPVTVSQGAYDSIQVTLPQASSGLLTGTVRRSSDAAGIPDAIVEALDTPAAATTVANGTYTVSPVPPATYLLRVERPGYAPVERVTTVQPSTAHTENFSLLRAAWYDSCDTDKGWSLSTAGDAATDGLWIRAKPVGSSMPGNLAAPAPRGAALTPPTSADSPFGASSSPGFLGAVQHPEPEEGGFSEAGPVQPGDDSSPGGGFCFVTANGAPNGDPAIGDVDGGRTTLTSPALNMSGMTEPTVGFRVWYYMNTPGEPDSMLIEVSNNGTSWVRARTYRTSYPAWRLEKLRIKDYVVPNSTVRVRFIAQDEGVGTIVEAAVDDFELHDATLVPSSVPTEPVASAPPVQLGSPRPNPANPARGGVTVDLRLRSAGDVRVQVYDVAGRLVAKLWDGPAPAGLVPVTWNGIDLAGRRAGSGVYWVRAEAAGETLSRRLVISR
jgi:choice-of-anchor B domain-containing protein